MTDENLSLYELMVILNPDLGEEATAAQIEKLKKFITDLEGKITHEDIWGIKNLAYTIKKEERGFYFVLNFELDPGKIGELKGEIMLEQTILRYMLLKAPKYYELKTLEELKEEAPKYQKVMTQEEKERKPRYGRKPAAEPAAAVEATTAAAAAAEPAAAAEAPAAAPEAPAAAPEAPEKEAPIRKKTPVEETVVEEEVEEKPAKEEPLPEPKKEPTIKLSDKRELEDVDAKLKSIIDDPDITL